MSDKIAEAVEGFGQMDVVQTAFNEYTVTSWRNDTLTRHAVDLSTGECSCEDYLMNCEGEEACAHLLKANHVAEARPDTSEHVMRFLSQEVRAVEQAAQSIEQTATSVEAHQQAGGGQDTSEPAESDESPAVGDPVESMKSLLRDAGLNPADFDIHVDDQFGSLQIEQDGYLDDGEFDTWVDFKEDTPIQYDPDGERNYLKEDDFPEVLA